MWGLAVLKCSLWSRESLLLRGRSRLCVWLIINIGPANCKCINWMWKTLKQICAYQLNKKRNRSIRYCGIHTHWTISNAILVVRYQQMMIRLLHPHMQCSNFALPERKVGVKISLLQSYGRLFKGVSLHQVQKALFLGTSAPRLILSLSIMHSTKVSGNISFSHPSKRLLLAQSSTPIEMLMPASSLEFSLCPLAWWLQSWFVSLCVFVDTLKVQIVKRLFASSYMST